MPHIAILLGTYNGAKFIGEQLRSLSAQTHDNWSLYVSDDGSHDDTLQIVRDFAVGVKQSVTIIKGECKGFCRNFLNMAENPEIKADYYAFCDQDDVWLPKKLEISLKAIEGLDVPAAFFTATMAIDEEGNQLGLSQSRDNPPGFRNAIIQSIAGANTTLFNQKAKALFENTPQSVIASHDWWLYMLVSGAGGRVIYSHVPHVLYRLHPENVIGPKVGNSWVLNRISRVFASQFKSFNDKNTSALAKYKSILTAENRDILEKFILARQSPLFKRLRIIYGLKLYRHTILNIIAFWVIVSLNKA